MTDVTIRGIDDEVYHEFSSEARRQNKSMGDLTTEAMRDYVQVLQPGGSEHVVSGLGELRVSSKDLKDVGTPVKFFNIKHLIFEDGVDDAYEKFVAGIYNCETVEFPWYMSKLRALVKCRHCSNVQFRRKIF